MASALENIRTLFYCICNEHVNLNAVWLNGNLKFIVCYNSLITTYETSRGVYSKNLVKCDVTCVNLLHISLLFFLRVDIWSSFPRHSSAVRFLLWLWDPLVHFEPCHGLDPGLYRRGTDCRQCGPCVHPGM